VLPGVTGLKGPLSCLSESQVRHPCGGSRRCRACFEAAADYARTREQFGQKIGGFQLTQRKLAWMLADLARAQLLALHLGRLKEAGTITPEQVSLARWPTCGRRSRSPARPGRARRDGVTLEYP